jgi:hypothetical protein
MSSQAEQLQQTMSFFKLEANAIATQMKHLSPKSGKPAKRVAKAATQSVTHAEPNETDFVKF